MIEASAPAKVVLFGEHAVMYGEPAIATAINKRAFVTACELDEPKIVIESKNTKESIEAKISEPATDMLVKAVQGALKYSGREVGIGIEIDSQIPIGSGLGSSASVSTATAAAVVKLLTGNLVTMEVAEISFESEKLLHGKLSGLDSAITTFGGTAFFKSGNLELMALRQELNFVVADTGIPANQKLVDHVKAYIEDPRMAHSMFSIGSLVRKAKVALETKGLHEIGHFMNMNHEFLRKLGVSSPELEVLVRAAIGAGAYGAKLSGMGGGGCVIALGEDPEILKTAMLEAGAVRAFKVKMNVEGVKIED